MKAPKYVIAPEGCTPYLTPDKRYEVRGWVPSTIFGGVFTITGDDGSERFARLKESAHTNGKDWIIPDDEAEAPADDERTPSSDDDRRFVAACHAMQGFCSNPDFSHADAAVLAGNSVEQADALLAALAGKDAQ